MSPEEGPVASRVKIRCLLQADVAPALTELDERSRFQFQRYELFILDLRSLGLGPAKEATNLLAGVRKWTGFVLNLILMELT